MLLVNLVNKFQKKFFSRQAKRTFFTTPSHSLGSFIIPSLKKIFGTKFFKADFSEIVSYKSEKSPIELKYESEEISSRIYNSKATFYLTNGSTSGILAAMLTSLAKDDKVLILRNCHKSVYSGLVLTGAIPIWLLPPFNLQWGIYEAINPSCIIQALDNNPDIKALIITNPTYEGVLSDIEKISDICKERNIILIVDEAHGALWNFDKTLGVSAVNVDADFCIQSLHKTAGALNSSAVLHIGKNSSINPLDLQKSLDLINTTSPSFPILANIEACIHFLNSNQGKIQLENLNLNIRKFKKALLKSNLNNIHIYSKNNDITKMLIKIDGLSGFELSEILLTKFNIEDELANAVSVLFLTGIGSNKKKFIKLKDALIKIAKNLPKFKSYCQSIDNSTIQLENNIEIPENQTQENLHIQIQDNFNYNNSTIPSNLDNSLNKLNNNNQSLSEFFISSSQVQPIVSFSPFDMRCKKSVNKSIELSLNCISNQLVVPYPPGVPVLIPGELIQDWHIQNLANLNSLQVLDQENN